MLPFTSDQFLAVFGSYNEAIWPAQIVAYVLGGTAVVSLFGNSGRSDRTIAAVLAIMWAWTGITYHLAFFAPINKAAYLFSALFIVQALALAFTGVLHHRLTFGFHATPSVWVGAFLVLYATVLYPLIGMVRGHVYPQLPMFGVTPCPVTIFTFGMLLLTLGPPSLLLFIVPVLWSLIGGSAAILLSVPQDWLLLVSGVLTVGMSLVRTRTGLAT